MDWCGPANNDTDNSPVTDDLNTTWNITANTNNGMINNNLVNFNRLNLNAENGLVIENVSSLDEGHYRCDKMENKSASSIYYKLLVKSRYKLCNKDILLL